MHKRQTDRLPPGGIPPHKELMLPTEMLEGTKEGTVDTWLGTMLTGNRQPSRGLIT